MATIEDIKKKQKTRSATTSSQIVKELIAYLHESVNNSNVPEALKPQIISAISGYTINENAGRITIDGPMKPAIYKREMANMTAVYDRENKYRKQYVAGDASSYIVYFGPYKSKQRAFLVLNYPGHKGNHFIDQAINRIRSKYPEIKINVSNY